MGERVRRNKHHVLKIWLARVRKEVLAATHFTDEEIVNSLDEYLDVLADLLGRPEDERATAVENVKIACKHAQQRIRLECYSIEDVMLEHDLLHQVLSEELQKDGPLGPRENVSLTHFIFRGMRAAVVEFHQQFTQQDQALKVSVERLTQERDLREQCVATLTHDLRQPLCAALITAQMLLRNPTVEGRDKLVSRILSNLHRIERMITDLLDATQIRVGQTLPLTIQETNLGTVCKNLIEELAPTASPRVKCVCKEFIIGYWDETNLRRVIENMLANAVKYGWQHTDITISIIKENDRVRIAVHNFGEQLNQSDLAQIFNPYFRTHEAKREGKKGWGLGLTLVRGIAEAHGGYAEVASRNEGITFSIVLPLDSRAHVANVLQNETL